MQTLAPPTLIRPDLSAPSCEQVVPGNVTPEEELEEEGHIGTGGAAPKPLQGEGDPETEKWDSDTGNEGAGT